MSINPKEIVFAIITYYPKWYNGKLKSISHTDKVRGDLALEFIQKTISLGFHLVVVDGKSSRSFKKILNNFPSIILIKKLSPKRSPAKRRAFKAASKIDGVKVIIASEGEKISLLDNIVPLVKPILENKADIVVPKREDGLFKETYPNYMYDSEKEGNKLYNEQLKFHNLTSEDDWDLFFGPRVFRNSPKILSLFLKKFHFQKNQKSLEEYFDPEEYSNALYFPVVIALQKGFRVTSVEIPFSYPKLQKINETVGAKEFFFEKRQTQRIAILLHLMYLLNYLQRKIKLSTTSASLFK